MAAEPDSERRHQRRRQQHTVVVLFTRDLRVHDHPALAAACASAGTVVPLFVLDPAITDIPAASANRMAFLCESLADLRASLIRRGAELYVRHGDVVDETMRVMERTGASRSRRAASPGKPHDDMAADRGSRLTSQPSPRGTTGGGTGNGVTIGQRSTRGGTVTPACPSSMRGCASCWPRASCTTGPAC